MRAISVPSRYTPRKSLTACARFTGACGQLLPKGVSTQEMDWWHGEDRELWTIASEPRILDLVEPILGPDFYLWGSQFFSKDPGDPKTTPWHQDAFFWPLAPHNSVTVWVAFEDSDADNGAMKVIPGTHRAQHIRHEDSDSGSDVLPSRVAQAAISPSTTPSICS